MLELGCGTGRVLVPLAASCGYIHGLDLSPAMVAICRTKLAAAYVPPGRAQVEVADITAFDLRQSFDLVVAPFRVMQNLEADAALAGLFRCVRAHLARGGTCVLNAFNPNRDRDTLRREWCSDAERFAWEVFVEGDRVTCHEKFARMDRDRLVVGHPGSEPPLY